MGSDTTSSCKDSTDGMVWLLEEEEDTYTSTFVKNINYLKRLFPLISDTVIHDTLVDCSNVLDVASSKLKSISGNTQMKKTDQNADVWLRQPTKSVDLDSDSEPHPIRPRRRLISSSSEEDLKVIPSNKANSSKDGSRRVAKKRSSAEISVEDDTESESDSYSGSDDSDDSVTHTITKSRKTKRKRVTVFNSDSEDGITDVLSSGDSKDSLKENLTPSSEDLLAEDEDDLRPNDDEEEDYDDIVDSSSGDEEDFSKVSHSKLNLREKVLSYLETATENDLLSIPSVSQKKAQSLMKLRPFSNWMDLVVKMKCDRALNLDIIDNCVELVKSREAIKRLMDECENISNKLRSTLEKLEPLDQPKILNKKMQLTHYQLLGLNWLVILYQNRINGILADEMGLGKTIQVIAFLSYLIENHRIRGQHLIIVPASTLDNWYREFNTWCKAFKVKIYHGSQNERVFLRHEMRSKKPDVIITTYNLLSSPDDRKFLARNSFEYVVFDEAHMLKNMRTARFKNLIDLRAKRRLLLTGTPVQNNLLELMSLLFFTMPNFFSSKLNHLNLCFQKGQKGETSFEHERILQARKILQPFILRRLKTDVLKQLPTKQEEIKMCEMTESQRELYQSLVESFSKEVRAGEEATKHHSKVTSINTRKGSAMLMQLRKVANHPLLLRTQYTDKTLRKMAKAIKKDPSHVDADEQRVFEDMEIMTDFELHRLCNMYEPLKPWLLESNFILDSGKFSELDKLLPEIKKTERKVLIFSQFVMMLDVLEGYLNLRGHEYLRLDGTTKVADRIGLIDKFTNNSAFVFLLSTKAGGLGINLTTANVVIIHDIDFNPYNDKQAEDRCHRLGQEKNVQVFRLISGNSVEEGILKIGDDKLKLGEDLYYKPNENHRNDSKDVKTLLRKTLGI